MAWLPDGEKNSEDIFIRFGATHERDGRTDGHRVTAYTALMHTHRAVKMEKKVAWTDSEFDRTYFLL